MLTIKTAGFEEYLDPSGGAWIKCLVLGEHGVGKTPSAARWPDPIIADCERGVMSVARLATPYATIESSKDMEELLDHLRKDSMLPPEKRKYRTLIIDTVDTYQRLLTAERCRAERKESLSGWADWGWLGNKGSWLLERLLNLQMHVVVNMHVKDEKDHDGETTTLVKKNRLKGDLAEMIYGDFDLIGLMEKTYVSEDGERVLKRHIRWHSEPKFPMLRDRSNTLPRFTEVDFTEDDFTRIFNAITSQVDELPESKTLETIESEPEVEPAAPDNPGGPVGNVKLPKNPPAKKTAAKAAKKTVPAQRKPAEIEQIEEGIPVDGRPVEEILKSEGDAAEAAEAQALLEETFGAEVVEETAVDAEGTHGAASSAGEEEPGSSPATSPSASTAITCGTVPDGLNGDPSLGCGKELNNQNAAKRQMSQLRTKTLLCDDCFEGWKSTH